MVKEGDILSVGGKKYIVTEADRGIAIRTQNLFEYVAKRLWDEGVQESYYDVIKKEMDKYK